MKRSNTSDDFSNPPKKAKLTDAITIPKLEENHIVPKEEISTFCDLVSYPPDVKVRGKDFEIPVHGVFLSVKSKSLEGILCQPGNSQERIWNLDEEITRASVTQFLSHFYSNVEPKFDGFDVQDFLGYQALIDMHLSDEDGAILKTLETKTSQIKKLQSWRKYFDQLSDDDKMQIISLLDFCCKKSITLSWKSWTAFYYTAMAMDVDLDLCHISYFLDFCYNPFIVEFSGPRSVCFECTVCILFYIAMKNDVPFDSLDLTKIDPPDGLDIQKMIKSFNDEILSRASFDKVKVNDMFTKAMLWMAKVK